METVRCDILEIITKLFLLDFLYLQILPSMEDSKPGSKWCSLFSAKGCYLVIEWCMCLFACLLLFFFFFSFRGRETWRRPGWANLLQMTLTRKDSNSSPSRVFSLYASLVIYSTGKFTVSMWCQYCEQVRWIKKWQQEVRFLPPASWCVRAKEKLGSELQMDKIITEYN